MLAEPLHRAPDGTLPAYAFPGGYPIAYFLADDGILCPDCASGKNGSEASECSEDPQWKLIGADIHWEGVPLICDHCNAEVESAYGDPDEE